MKLRQSLYFQIFAAVFLYLFSLAVLGFIAFNAQFGIGWQALFNSPAGDRVDTIRDAIESQLRSANRQEWNQILAEFEHIYGAKFYLFAIDGTQIAGESVQLPDQLHALVVGPPWLLKMRHGLHGWSRSGQSDASDPRLGFGMANLSGARRSPAEAGLQKSPGRKSFADGPMPGPAPPDGFNPPEPPPGGPSPSGASPDVGPQAGLGPPPGTAQRGDGFMPPGVPFGPPPDGGMPPTMSLHPHERFLVHTKNPDRFWCVMHTMMPSRKDSPPEPISVVASPDNLWQSSLLFDFKFVFEACLVAVAMSSLFWCPLVYSITRALSEVAYATEKIADGKFDTRVKNKRRDEIGRLANAVNTMAHRLEDFVSGQKRLLGDISHELFTPIARLQMALELLDAHVPAQHKDLVSDIREEVTEMTHLVSELLAFSKAGVKGPSIVLESVSLNDMLERLVRRLDLTDKVTTELSGALTVLADAMLLERAFANVLRNSVRYAGESGPINIAAKRLDESKVIVLIDDNGPGVPPDAIKYIGEPFFRPEVARDRESGGAGLGLAIVKTCIEACHGKVDFRNRSTGGFEVEVILLAAPQEEQGASAGAGADS